MALESFSGIWSLNVSNPTTSDDVSQGDDHLRGIKTSIRQTFPRISSTIGVTASEINHLSGVASNVKNALDALSASLQAEISRTNTLSASLATVISTSDTLSQSLLATQSNLNDVSKSLQAEISRTNTLSASLQSVINTSIVAYGGFYVATPSIRTATDSPEAMVMWDAPQPSSNITLGTAAGSLTIVSPGKYFAAANFSFTGAASTDFTLRIYKSDNETPIQARRAMGATPTIGSAAMSGIVSANAGDVFKVRLSANATSSNFSVVAANFSLVRFSS